MGFFGSSDTPVDDGGLSRRVEELERRVAALEWAQREADASPPPNATGGGGNPVSAEVSQLVMQGKKIQAIKVLREQTGLGLKEAKDIVDRLMP